MSSGPLLMYISVRSTGPLPLAAASLARSLARSIPCLPNPYGGAVVDGEAVFREGPVELVHGCQVLPGLAVALVARLLELLLLGGLLPLLLVKDVAADEGEADDEPVLGGELVAHLEVVFEVLAVEAEEDEVGRLDDHFVEVVDLPGVEADGVGLDHLGQALVVIAGQVLYVVALDGLAVLPDEGPQLLLVKSSPGRYLSPRMSRMS